MASRPKPPGSYRVYAHPINDENPRDIMFELADVATTSVPKEQGMLKSESEKTLHVLRNLFPPQQQDEKFRVYFKELLGLCQYGLIGPTAEPSQAMDTLRNLQHQVYENEKGRAISAYMSSTIKWQSLWFGVLLAGLIILGVCAQRWLGLALYENYLPIIAVVPGLFIGLIFSSFMRCRAITFFDLHAIEADRFTPGLKLAFAMTTLILAAVFLKAELFEIKIGKAQLSLFDKDWLAAFVLGAMVGVAQEAVIARIETIRKRLGASER